ncbi:MAG TPA: hypothetical protein VHA33_08785 [Candidatus Angelobacter sp.]|nr:hypothetical protein [Candidatus Angelobacter sp.]
MKLKGILDFSLGNFLCLRGFAPMGVLFDISEAAPSIQRDLLKDHRAEMIAFLSQGEFLFFPEVILCATLNHDGETNEAISALFEHVQRGERFSGLKFDDLKISCSVSKLQGIDDTRSVSYFNTATVLLNKSRKYKLWRIDGNHRLSATPEDPKFRKHNTPFCFILFRDTKEADRLSRALFHNINYKQIPLTMEQNLKLILDDNVLFSDDKLKTGSSFGWPYYLARQLNDKLDFDLLPNLKPIIEKEPRTFLIQQFTFLTEKHVLGDNENALKRFKTALVQVNGLFDERPSLRESTNRGLLAALVYYELHSPPAAASFVRWVLENHLYAIADSTPADLIQIFDKVLESRKRTIFVSMPFGKTKTDDHYAIIQRVCKEVSDAHNLKPELRVERVDWFHDGTSYAITDKIIKMMSDCGLLIGNLTHCNPNVYHEIGFVMGKAKAEGKDVTDKLLLFLDVSVAAKMDKDVAFNLKGHKQLRFTKAEAEFAPALRENIERFFRLK